MTTTNEKAILFKFVYWNRKIIIDFNFTDGHTGDKVLIITYAMEVASHKAENNERYEAIWKIIPYNII